MELDHILGYLAVAFYTLPDLVHVYYIWWDRTVRCIYVGALAYIRDMHAYQTVRCSTAGWARKTIWVSSGWDFEELKR